jgi:hypothetical protein
MLSTEDLLDYRRLYYKKKKEAASSREYWRKNPEKLKARNARRKKPAAGSFTRWKYRAPEKAIWSAAKHRAARDGIPFTITPEEIQIPAVCPVLGIPLSFSTVRERGCSPSLDKVNNSAGYVSGNVQVISSRANKLKGDGTAEEHEAIAAYMRAVMGTK